MNWQPTLTGCIARVYGAGCPLAAAVYVPVAKMAELADAPTDATRLSLYLCTKCMCDANIHAGCVLMPLHALPDIYVWSGRTARDSRRLGVPKRQTRPASTDAHPARQTASRTSARFMQAHNGDLNTRQCSA